jgi:hypothetical protein
MGLLDSELAPMIGGLLGEGWRRFRGVDPATGEANYWKRGGLAGLLGMPSWDEQSPTDIAMGFAGSTTPAVKGIAGALAKPTQGIRAYHGSPHDFDKFDLSKIGTGEGAQAYGHGLYFAENERVAKAYRDALSNNLDDAARNVARNYFDSSAGDVKAAIEKLRRDAEKSGSAQYARAADILEGGAPAPGRMYEVEINADPERFVDFDAAVDPRVREIINREMMPMLGKSGLEGFWGAAPKTNEAYTRAERALPRGHLSEAMLREGIPGIKYLDQGSRNSVSVADASGTISMLKMALRKHPNDAHLARELANAESALEQAQRGQSRNYVVFDDSLISILRKYGLLPPIAAGAVAPNGLLSPAEGGAP